MFRNSLTRLGRSTVQRWTAVSRPAVTRVAVRAMATGGAALADLKAASPHVDVVRYEHKNRTWSLNHVDYYSTAMAIGFIDGGLRPSDVILSWLPEHFSEQMILQFACSKAGLVLYTLKPAGEDTAAAQDALTAALTLTKANMLVTPEAYNDLNYIRLVHGVIPELRVFTQEKGLPFVTPRFPHLRYPVHTGFDQLDKEAWLPYRYFLVPSDNLDKLIDTSKLTDKTPLAGTFELDAKGIPTKLGPTLTNQQVFEKNIWPTYNSILQKKFHDVEGIGNIW
uniref:AMP-dependent synthetase/ligase domain-containing protein n=1 Tax=Amphora coffeiformis TaxID=265554 RepID=A0A7S3L418_9STRA|mmetsp:Transcript_9175/g.17493  ORF Transcript_9175/g.17493 Transcript_9175/m.17493 type:complete len:280 (+) Transcript_9175:96-935(+)